MAIRWYRPESNVALVPRGMPGPIAKVNFFPKQSFASAASAGVVTGGRDRRGGTFHTVFTSSKRVLQPVYEIQSDTEKSSLLRRGGSSRDSR